MKQRNTLSVLATAILGLFAIVPSVNAAPPHGTPVVIQNNTSDPVPVNGNVVVSGTANVNVTNTVPVAVAGPVTVTTASPIPVHGSGMCTDQPNGYFTNWVYCPLYTVPAGKRLIVDSVSWMLYRDPSDTSFSALFFGTFRMGVGLFAVGRSVIVPMTINHTFSPDRAISLGTQSAFGLMFDEGETISGNLTNSLPFMLQEFSFEGHLVNQ